VEGGEETTISRSFPDRKPGNKKGNRLTVSETGLNCATKGKPLDVLGIKEKKFPFREEGRKRSSGFRAGGVALLR